jgi:hypothetical protein
MYFTVGWIGVDDQEPHCVKANESLDNDDHFS